MFTVWLGVTGVISALFWERNSQRQWKTSMAFLLRVAQFCQEQYREAAG